MSDDFFRTRMGHTYYNGTLPQMVKQVGRLADSIAALNETLRTRPALCEAPHETVAPPARPRVLLVDDDERLLRGLARALKVQCDVSCATSAEAALEILDAGGVDAVLTDHSMPEHDGLWLLAKARERHPRVRRLLTSGHPPDLDEHLESGLVEAFLAKPVSINDVVATLREQPPKRCVKCGDAIPEPQLRGDERCARCGDDP